MAAVTKTVFSCDTAPCTETLTLNGPDNYYTSQAARQLGWDVLYGDPVWPGDGDHCPGHTTSQKGQ